MVPSMPKTKVDLLSEDIVGAANCSGRGQLVVLEIECGRNDAQTEAAGERGIEVGMRRR
jgi:hypothetical protein